METWKREKKERVQRGENWIEIKERKKLSITWKEKKRRKSYEEKKLRK